MNHRFVRRGARTLAALLLLILSGCTGTTPPPSGGNTEIDTDGDGFSDDFEENAVPGSDPRNPDDTPDNPIDSDGDGCSDFDEINFENFCDNDPNTDQNGTPTGNSNTFSLRVARHVDQRLGVVELDAIFRTASDVLQSVEFNCPDLATNVTFVRDGDIETFNEGNAVVTTEAQLDDLFALPQDFKVVEAMIGVCGSEPSDLTTLLGCAFSNGSVVIIADAPPDVWAHEWGHVQGLGHRDNCGSNLMHASNLETDAVNQRERAAFLSPGPKLSAAQDSLQKTEDAAGIEPDSCCPREWERADGEPLAAWLDRVLPRRYLAGVPAILSVALGADRDGQNARRGEQFLGPVVRSAFSEPSDTQRRANIARLAGLSGAADAVPELIAAVLAPAGPLSRDEFNGCTEAILALGRLAPADPSGAAMAFLVSGTDPTNWPGRGVKWSFGKHQGERLHRLLVKLCIMGLGLAESDDALAHLRELRGRIDAGSLDAEAFTAQVDEAIIRCQGMQVKSKHSVQP